MLTEDQAKRVWEKMLGAEARSLYFAGLASDYNRRKQIISGASFFLASGAASALIAKLPDWVPLVLSVIAALTTAYLLAVNLDRNISTMTKLHCEWNALSADYERLWNHWRDPDAENQLAELLRRAADASEVAIEIPYKAASLDRWQKIVYSRVSPSTAQ